MYAINITEFFRETQQAAYRIKHELLENYLCQQLKRPVVSMYFAQVLIRSFFCREI